VSTRCPAPTLPLPDLKINDVAEWTDTVLRIYASKGDYAASWSEFRYYGPVDKMRFDHQPGRPRLHPTRGISYAAGPWVTPQGEEIDPFEVTVLECFKSTGVIDRHTDGPRYVLWKPTRPLRLLQLSDGDWLARAGGNGALTSGARPVARTWSRAIYDSYPDVDGLIWSSSVLTGGRSMALYERAEDALPTAPASDRTLAEPFLQPALGRIAGKYGLTLI